MAIDKLILFQKAYDFLLWLYPLVNRLPKHHRAILGKQIEELGICILLNIMSANDARGQKRKQYQQIISSKIDQLRILLRLTKDLRFMSTKQYAYACQKVNELGSILSGWMKSATSKRVEKHSGNVTLFE